MQANPEHFFGFGSEEALVDYNYLLQDGLAYTEDRILVHNIFLYKISRKVRTEDVKKYFEQFGEITKFHIVLKNKCSRVGFLHFKEAKAAANVLGSRCHKIDKSKIVWVKACDSWHQPLGDCSKIFLAQNDEENIDLDNSHDWGNIAKTGIIDTTLDDDCLFILYKYMQLRDQINFACSHARFASVFRSYAKVYYKTIDANDLECLSLWNIRQFLMLAGQYVNTFTGTFQHNYRDRVVNFIKIHCPNIEEIRLYSTQMSFTSLRKMFSNKPKLTTLYLIDCGISDHDMYAISKLTHLESLAISRSINCSGRHLHWLKNLTKLRLVCCGYLQSSNLLKALSSMPQLRFLDLRGSEQLRKEFFEKLPYICKNLEVLQISCHEIPYDNISKIPKLKNLSLSANYSIDLRTDLLHRLIEEKQQLEFLQILPNLNFDAKHCQLISKLNSLKKLHLSSGSNLNDNCLDMLSELKELDELKVNNCKNITNNGLFEMVIKCKQLKLVNIQNTEIDNNFVDKIIKYIKKNKRLAGCITFLVAGSKINKRTLPEICNSEYVKSLVRLEFDYSTFLNTNNHFCDAFETTDLVMTIPFFSIDDIYESDSYDDDSDFEFGFDDYAPHFMNLNIIALDPLDEHHIGLDGDDADMLFW